MQGLVQSCWARKWLAVARSLVNFGTPQSDISWCVLCVLYAVGDRNAIQKATGVRDEKGGRRHKA